MLRVKGQKCTPGDFWHDFLPCKTVNKRKTCLNKKYLAYAALLAGWIILCYWLYANRIAPHIHLSRETSQPEFVEGLLLPFAFRWGSFTPLSGEGYDSWRKLYANIDSTNEILVLRGHYFRDEADSLFRAEQLAQERLDRALFYLQPDPKRIVTTIRPQEINADVRRFPFEAVTFERFHLENVIRINSDTLELCFPLADSFALPPMVTERVGQWLKEQFDRKRGNVNVTGTADGTGIAESTDEALGRANEMYKMLLQYGWKDEEIFLTTGQRNHPLTLRNRCVIVYFE